MKKIKKALISVSDKKDLGSLLKVLAKYKIELISSGGTFKEIKKLKFKCQEVSEYTGSPEILGGRVKTLHPKIHAGILSKRNDKSHTKELKANQYDEIDLVIVNFYPFEKTLDQTTNHSKIIENIDVGGPTMVRAAAKNYNDVAVITSSDQYETLINELENNKGSTSIEFREKMSLEAFSETAYYDAVISNYFNKIKNNNFPKKKIIYGNLIEKLRLGNAVIIEVNVDGNIKDQNIEPMLLLTLVENAFKHSENVMAADSFVKIHIVALEHGFRFLIENSYNPSKKSIEMGGIGLQNIQKRLNLLM